MSVPSDTGDLVYISIPVLRSQVARVTPLLLSYAARVQSTKESTTNIPPKSEKVQKGNDEIMHSKDYRALQSNGANQRYLAIGDNRINRWLSNVCECGTCRHQIVNETPTPVWIRLTAKQILYSDITVNGRYVKFCQGVKDYIDHQANCLPRSNISINFGYITTTKADFKQRKTLQQQAADEERLKKKQLQAESVVDHGIEEDTDSVGQETAVEVQSMKSYKSFSSLNLTAKLDEEQRKADLKVRRNKLKDQIRTLDKEQKHLKQQLVEHHEQIEFNVTGNNLSESCLNLFNRIDAKQIKETELRIEAGAVNIRQVQQSLKDLDSESNHLSF